MGPGFSFFSPTKHVTERTFRCPHTPPKIYNFFGVKKNGKDNYNFAFQITGYGQFIEFMIGMLEILESDKTEPVIWFHM